MTGSHLFRKKQHIMKICKGVRQLISLGSFILIPSFFKRYTEFEKTV